MRKLDFIQTFPIASESTATTEKRLILKVMAMEMCGMGGWGSGWLVSRRCCLLAGWLFGWLAVAGFRRRLNSIRVTLSHTHAATHTHTHACTRSIWDTRVPTISAASHCFRCCVCWCCCFHFTPLRVTADCFLFAFMPFSCATLPLGVQHRGARSAVFSNSSPIHSCHLPSSPDTDKIGV